MSHNKHRVVFSLVFFLPGSPTLPYSATLQVYSYMQLNYPIFKYLVREKNGARAMMYARAGKACRSQE